MALEDFVIHECEDNGLAKDRERVGWLFRHWNRKEKLGKMGRQRNCARRERTV